MSKQILTLVACFILTGPIASALAQMSDGKMKDAADDFPAPAKGFDTRRDGIDRGKLETVQIRIDDGWRKAKSTRLHPAGI